MQWPWRPGAQCRAGGAPSGAAALSPAMQDRLFDDDPLPPAPPVAPASPEANDPPPRGGRSRVLPCVPDPALQALAAGLPSTLRLGTSSWSYPGWDGLVWQGGYSDTQLSRQGLEAYAQHPLLRAVSIDRGFYRPLTASQFARYAAQVPDDFRFVVKAPSLVCDALVRGEDGRGLQANPAFLDAALATQEFVQPALDGLGHKIGALVFQLSPLPGPWLSRLPELLQRLACLLQAQPALRPLAPDAVLAVEVRDPALVSPELAAVLRATGATYCLGLHPKLPPLAEQLPLLRALWPGPLVCRWNLNLVHGAYGYEDAAARYSPYDRLHDPDLPTRTLLARTVAGVTGAGQSALVTVSNKAEGCAPLTVRALAEAVQAQRGPTG